jgi:hypothetical protein
MTWADYGARMGESIVAYLVLVGKPETRKPLEKHKHKWEDNIEMDLKEVGWGGTD